MNEQEFKTGAVKLRRCTSCESSRLPEIWQELVGNQISWRARCMSCKCCTPQYHDQDTAVKHWNYMNGAENNIFSSQSKSHADRLEREYKERMKSSAGAWAEDPRGRAALDNFYKVGLPPAVNMTATEVQNRMHDLQKQAAASGKRYDISPADDAKIRKEALLKRIGTAEAKGYYRRKDNFTKLRKKQTLLLTLKTEK